MLQKKYFNICDLPAPSCDIHSMFISTAFSSFSIDYELNINVSEYDTQQKLRTKEHGNVPTWTAFKYKRKLPWNRNEPSHAEHVTTIADYVHHPQLYLNRFLQRNPVLLAWTVRSVIIRQSLLVVPPGRGEWRVNDQIRQQASYLSN